ncbi:MAG: ATP synthase F1 subunit epsilon [Clostridiales bacterium]|nr:ATP synthase F1 subunit epsilon [Clostridiales bacterium]
MPKLRLKIATPKKLLYDGEADMVILRTSTGDMGILPGHHRVSAIMGYGALKIVDGENKSEVAVMGGLAQVSGDAVTVLSEVAEWPSEISLIRAEAALERARQRLAQKDSDVDMQRAELSLRRALVRIEVSSYPIIRPGK